MAEPELFDAVASRGEGATLQNLLAFHVMSVLNSDMVIVRDFIRQFSRHKRTAESGKAVRVVDRQGRRFVFMAERPKKLRGAASGLSKGVPVSPDPIPTEEWKGSF